MQVSVIQIVVAVAGPMAEVVGLVAAAGLVDPVATVLVQEQTLVVR